MGPKFYVASALHNREQVAEVVGTLEKAGWKVTYNWAISPMTGDWEQGHHSARYEILGASEAKVFVALMPGYKGTHVEMGAALASNAEVYIWAPRLQAILGNIPPMRSIFYDHPNVQIHCCSLEEFLDWIIQKYAEKGAV